MATRHEIQNEHDSLESDMGFGRSTSWKKPITLQMGVPIQVCIRLRETQVQSSACRERIQTGTRGQLRRDILSSSQDDHPPTPTRSCGDRRPRGRVDGCKHDIPTRRSRRRHIHVSTGRLQGDKGG